MADKDIPSNGDAERLAAAKMYLRAGRHLNPSAPRATEQQLLEWVEAGIDYADARDTALRERDAEIERLREGLETISGAIEGCLDAPKKSRRSASNGAVRSPQGSCPHPGVKAMTAEHGMIDKPRDSDAERLARKVILAVEDRISADGWSARARQSLFDVVADVIAPAFDAALRDRDAEIERLRKVAEAAREFESDLSEYCDGPSRDALREALAALVPEAKT